MATDRTRRETADADVDARLALSAQRQLGVFTREQALDDAGMSRHQLDRRVRSRRVRRAHSGVFVDNAAPKTWEQAVMAAVLAAGNAAAASYLTAAALHGFPDVLPGGPVEVSVPPGRHPRLRSVVVHRVQLHPDDTAFIGPIPVTTFARTLVDGCGALSLGQLARALDDGLVRRRTSLRAVEACLARLAPGRLRRTSMLWMLLDERDPAVQLAESRPEIRVRGLIARAGLPEPVLQHPVVADGRRYRLDLAYPDRCIALEYQGFDAHRTRRAFDRDFRRHRDLTVAGWTVYFLTGAMSDDDVVRTVSHALAAATRRPA